jgi:hypothetical protein
MKIRELLALSSLLIVLCGSVALADVIVAPNTQAAAEGNDNNFGPFFDTSVRYQQVYSASQFPSTGPLSITQIAFRPDASVTNPSLFIRFDSVRIDLSTTSRTPGTLSTVFANNVGANNTTVFDSFLFINTPVTGPAAGPKNFIVTFTLSPFTYDPSLGNLLLDVRAFESGGGISAPFDAQSSSPFTAHVDASGVGSTSGSIIATGLVTQFQFTPVQATATPEPSAMLLTSAGVLLLASLARWRSRRTGLSN